MLAMIDFFTFDIDNRDIDSISSYLTFKFARHEKLGNFDSFQNIGRYEEEITIHGTLICQSQHQLKSFELLGKMKTQHILTLPDGTCKTIIITTLDTDKSTFLKTGEFLRQEYALSIAVVGDGFNLDIAGMAASFLGGLL
ncbi:MAG TPA: hypothetical protein CFH81_00465 [Sulfurovum sp. UBA12169]|nr:MAG TPA: hypothetical protein CFH81_00465 [Sulfurovum sp. UBA12169]